MLIFSRKPDESVVVGRTGDSPCLLKVTVLEIHQGKVKLGFETVESAPNHELIRDQNATPNRGQLVQANTIAKKRSSESRPRRELNESLSALRRSISRHAQAGRQ